MPDIRLNEYTQLVLTLIFNKIFNMRIFKYIIIAVSFTGLLTSCSDDFLDRQPQGSYVEETYYVSDAALEAATAPLYNRCWFDYHERAIHLVGSVRANEHYNKYQDPQWGLNQVTALDGHLVKAWQGLYSVVVMSNSVIDAVQNKCTSEVSEKAKQTALGEARLMRGVTYFYLLRIWGPVILFENNQTIVDNPIQPRHTEADIFQFIINDLKYASEALPESAAKGRATCWSAKAFLAKAYLARSGWGNTERNDSDLELARQTALDVCINSGLQLLNDYADLFKYKQNNNQESLLALQWVPNGSWYYCNTLYADLCFGTEITGGVNVWGGSDNIPMDMLRQYERADTIRRNATYFTKGSYYPYICIADGGYTFTGNWAKIKKGAIGGPDDDNDGYVKSMNSPLNTYLIRLADCYLTLAEACLGNKQELTGGEGLEYFNKLRERAGIPAKDRITFDDIIRERRVEFAMEYVNWLDMVSWYKWQPDKMMAYFNEQQRGIAAPLYKEPDGTMVFYEDSGNYQWSYPEITVTMNHDNVFLPYPEADVIQNPLLNRNLEPQPYY